jgi:hypothetical protein
MAFNEASGRAAALEMSLAEASEQLVQAKGDITSLREKLHGMNASFISNLFELKIIFK